MDMYKDEMISIFLTRDYLRITIPGDVTDLEIFKESKLVNGEIWTIKLLDKCYGVFFDSLFPQLEQGVVSNLMRSNKNVLKIPLVKSYHLTEQIYYMIKEPYNRNEKIILYWTNKIKMNLN